jgi:hypothetical protein
MAAGQPITVSVSIGDPQTGTIKGSTVIPAPSLGNIPICPSGIQISLAATPTGDQQVYPTEITYANIQTLGFVATLVTAGTGVPVVILKLKGASGLSAVNAIYDTFVVDSGGTGAGTFTITVEGVTTGAIPYSPTYGTLESNINSALATAGIGATASGGSLGAIILTFSSGRHVGRPIFGVSMTVVTWTGTAITIAGNTFSTSTIGTTYTISATTPGVSTDIDFMLAPSAGLPNGVVFSSLPSTIAANITSITCQPSLDGSVVQIDGKIYVTT